MALYTPHSIFHLARLSYVSPETFGPYYVHLQKVILILISILNVNDKVTLWLAVLRRPTRVYGTKITSPVLRSLSDTVARTARSTRQFSTALCQIIYPCCAQREIKADELGGIPGQAAVPNNTNISPLAACNKGLKWHYKHFIPRRCTNS